MLIILEGPDGAGKSTLAREIFHYLGQHRVDGVNFVELLHKGPPTRHPLDEYEHALLWYRPGQHHVVCDRWHIGEAVYPEVLGRETKWDVAIQRHLYLFMRSRGACLVGIDASLAELTERLIARGDDLIDATQLHAVKYGYARLASQFSVWGGDTRLTSPRSVVDEASRLEKERFGLDHFETYVGPPTPNVLLLGDVRQPSRTRRRETHKRMPAFCPYPSTSGHYLLTHLDVETHRVGLANACDVDDPLALWKMLGAPSVVALGRNAAARLRELSVPHGAVPHPQFVRRFHHGHGAAYAAAIVQAAYRQEDMLSWRP